MAQKDVMIMSIIKLRNLVIIVATLFGCTSCGGGRTTSFDVALRTCLYQANYNYLERRRSSSVNDLYNQAVDLCYKQRNACAQGLRNPVCAAFLRKYPR